MSTHLLEWEEGGAGQDMEKVSEGEFGTQQKTNKK